MESDIIKIINRTTGRMRLESHANIYYSFTFHLSHFHYAFTIDEQFWRDGATKKARLMCAQRPSKIADAIHAAPQCGEVEASQICKGHPKTKRPAKLLLKA